MRKRMGIAFGIALSFGVAGALAFGQPGIAEAKATPKAPTGKPAIQKLTCKRISLNTFKVSCKLKKKAKGKVSGYQYEVNIASPNSSSGGGGFPTTGKSGKLTRTFRVAKSDVAYGNGTPRDASVQISAAAFSKKGSKTAYGKWSKTVSVLFKGADVNLYKSLSGEKLRAKAEKRINSDMARVSKQHAAALSLKDADERHGFAGAFRALEDGKADGSTVIFPVLLGLDFENDEVPAKQVVGSFAEEVWGKSLGNQKDSAKFTLNRKHVYRGFVSEDGDENVSVLASCLKDKSYEKTDYEVTSLKRASKRFVVGYDGDEDGSGKDTVTSRYVAQTKDGKKVYLSSGLVVLDVK